MSRKQKRATFDSCTSSEQTKLNTAATNAKTYATNTYTYVNGISAATTRYTTWFGKCNYVLAFTVSSNWLLKVPTPLHVTALLSATTRQSAETVSRPSREFQLPYC